MNLNKFKKEAHAQLKKWRDSFGTWEPHESLKVDQDHLNTVLDDLVERLKGNYPFHHPVYAGQMLKPPHEVARLAYDVAMTINPNNHALDGGPPSSEMEKEVMSELAQFFGYGQAFLGHLSASGTIANLEALWIARQIHPQKGIAFSSDAHYTHERMCAVLDMKSFRIDKDQKGNFIFKGVQTDKIGTLVVTMGTTGMGDVEPLEQALKWADEHNIRIHIDAAYGGFFKTLENSGLIDGRAWKKMHEADSIVVDPHKHGLQPYGCGAVLFRDPSVGTYYKHDSPYTYFTSDDLHLGEISLECSRAGASAVAFWTTLQCFPLEESKGFGPVMKACRNAALKSWELMNDSELLTPFKKPELDILTYYPIPDKEHTTGSISALSKKVFEQGMENKQFYVSLYRVKSSTFAAIHPDVIVNSDEVVLLRSVFMKPEHEHFVPELIKRLEKAVISG